MWLNPGQGGWAMADSDAHTGMCYVLGVSTSVSYIATGLSTKTTAGADASVEPLKLYHMRLLTLAYLALLGRFSSRSSY